MDESLHHRATRAAPGGSIYVVTPWGSLLALWVQNDGAKWIELLSSCCGSFIQQTRHGQRACGRCRAEQHAHFLGLMDDSERLAALERALHASARSLDPMSADLLVGDVMAQVENYLQHGLGELPPYNELLVKPLTPEGRHRG